jgi:hypothetical protein
MDLDLSKPWDDNLGDILTMRYTPDDDSAYKRFARYLHRRDVCLNDKVRAWNHACSVVGDLGSLVASPEGISKIAKAYPSDC